MKSSEEIQTVALLSATPALSHQSQLMTWSIAENDPVWGEGRGNFIVFKIQVFGLHPGLTLHGQSALTKSVRYHMLSVILLVLYFCYFIVIGRAGENG